MKVMGLEIPEQVLAAGRAEMEQAEFVMDDVRCGVARALRLMEFNFGIQHPASVQDRVADRLLQQEKRAGRVVYSKVRGKWRRVCL
jgi:hypothetical protein